MTTRYECDRCHKQFADDRALTKVAVSNENIGTHVYHYCTECSTIFLNAMQIVNNGDYQGSLDPDDKISSQTGRYMDFPPIKVVR